MGIDTINNNINAVLGGAITASRKPLPGCVLSYDFLDKVQAGGKILDRSGRGNHGTITGNCCAVGDGIARFRSSNDKITLPVPTNANGLASTIVTLSIWIYIKSLQTYGESVFRAGTWQSKGYVFIIGSNGKITLECDAPEASAVVNQNQSAAGRWQHIIATLDTDTAQLIQDASIKQSNSISFAIAKPTSALIIGNVEGIVNIGHLDLYNRILTDEEYRYLYESDAHRYQNPVPGNIALSLQFNEINTSGNNGIAVDTSGNVGRSGTWNNAANPDVLYVPGPNYVNDSSQKVVAFDGGNDYIKIPTTDGQPALGYNPNSYTFMTWINQRAASNATGNGAAACHLFAWNDGTNDKEYIGLNEKYQDTTINEGMITYFRSALATYGEAWQPMSNQYLKSAEWHHLAVVVENRMQTSPDTMMAVRFFIDGSLVYTTFTSPSGAISDLSTCGIRIGMGKSGAAFSGCLKDIKLRMSALSNADVLAYYNSTKGDYPAADSTILLDMPLDDNTQAGDGTNITQIAKDVSHRCLHGTWNAGCSAAALAPDEVTKVAVFDRVDDKITLLAITPVVSSSGASYGLWINPSIVDSTAQVLFSFAGLISVTLQSSGLTFYHMIGSTVQSYSATAPNANEWAYYIFTASTADGKLRIYKNGNLVATSPAFAGTIKAYLPQSIGSSMSGKQWGFRIRNVALDAAGVKVSYNANCLKFGLPQI